MLRTTSFEGLQLLDKADSTWAALYLGNTIYKAFRKYLGDDGFDGMDNTCITRIYIPSEYVIKRPRKDTIRHFNFFCSAQNHSSVTSLQRLYRLCRCCLHGHPAGPPIHIIVHSYASQHFQTRCLHPRYYCHPFSSS